MHVEIEAPDNAACLQHLPAFDRRVPDRRVGHATERHTEEAAGNVEHTVLHLIIGEIRPDLLGIELVIATGAPAPGNIPIPTASRS